MTDAGQLYVIPGKGTTTHLAKIEGWNVYMLCFPNVARFMCNCDNVCPTKHDPDCGVEADREWAAWWDERLAEVNCPTCLKRARR